MNTVTDYDKDACERLAKCGGSLGLTLSDSKTAPWTDADAGYRPHYRCTLKGPGGSYTFDFWHSLNAGKTGEKATTYDVLACLEWHTPEVFADFCGELGYNTDSRSAHRTWKACIAMTRALHRIFPSETARETLAEIR